MATKSKQFETPMGVVTATAEYLRHFILTIPGADGQPVKIGRIMRGSATWAAGYADDKRSYFGDTFGPQACGQDREAREGEEGQGGTGGWREGPGEGQGCSEGEGGSEGQGPAQGEGP